MRAKQLVAESAWSEERTKQHEVFVMFNSYWADYSATRQNKEPVMSLGELSRTKGISYSTLYYRMKKHPLEVKFLSRGIKHYSIKELAAWLRERET